MLCSLPRSCLVHPVDRFDSEGWFSSDQMIFLTVFRVFLVKKHVAFKWKDAISGFPVSPCRAEALVRFGGKIKYILIAYFLGNICAKNCRNRTVYVKIIASCTGGTFFETQCRLPCSKAGKTRTPLKFPGVPQTHQQISAVSRRKFTILRGRVREVLAYREVFSHCRYMP